MDEKLRREREFHNVTFTGDTRAAAERYYAVTGRSRERYRERILNVAEGDVVLEYGCATGSNVFNLARKGAVVHGIDISDSAIELARRHAKRMGVEDRVTFHLMNAEALEFPAGMFDLVCGTGILHHLDLEKAYAEVARVLKPDGRGVFLEPLGHNPLINAYRRFTPSMRTEDEHPLLDSDLQGAGTWFRNVDAEYFHLLSLAAVPLKSTFGFAGIVKVLEASDDALFRIVPRMRDLAWRVLVELSRPRRAAVKAA